jgi:hypothetical protein
LRDGDYEEWVRVEKIEELREVGNRMVMKRGRERDGGVILGGCGCLWV